MKRRIGILAMGLALAVPVHAVEPDTAIQQPSADVMSSLVTVSGTAADADGTVSNVQVRLCETITNSCWDGVFQFDFLLSYFNPEDGWFNATPADGTFDSAAETWTDSVSHAALTGMEGNFVIQARAVDDAADTDSTPATKIFTIDATPPDTSVATPVHGSSRLTTTEIGGIYVDLNISTIQVRVQDLSTGEYWNGGAGFGSAEFWSTATIVGPFFTQSFGATLVSGHTYNIVTKGFDTAGNVQSVFTVGFSSTTFTHYVLPPSTAGVTGLHASSATANWALTLGSTGYSLIASTDAANPPSGVAVSSNTSSEIETNAALTGLSPNTTYYFGVKALGPSTATAYNQFAASATLANPPTGTAVSSVGEATVALGWNANSNPSTTEYVAEISAASNFGSLAASSMTLAASAQFAGLTPNTTYYLRVRAVGHGGTATAYDTSVTTATEAAVPVTPAVVANSSTQITFTWAANGNPSGTSYTAQISTASDFSGTLTSSATLLTSATFFSLTSAATYYARVKATGHGGTDTNFTTPTSTVTAAGAAPTDAISGTVTVNPNQEVNLVQITLSASGGTVATVFSDAGGNWSFTGLSTDTGINYTIQASWKLSDGDATSIVSQSGHQVGTTGIAMGLGLSVTLGSITGTLSLQGSSPAGSRAAASAAAVPSGAFVEIYRGQLAARVATDSQGGFTVPKLLPGTYQLRPFNGVEFGETITVRLAEGESAAVAFNDASAAGANAKLFDPKAFYFYPNPARNRTTIRFESKVSAIDARVFIFDITGSLVREFSGAEASRSGAEVSWGWDLTDNRGRAVAPGIYLVRVKVVGQATGTQADATKKLAVVR